MTCDDSHCITCADDGVPMRVLELDEARGLALCADGDGERSTVEIGLVGPVERGDSLLVHAGTALARLEGEALSRLDGEELALLPGETQALLPGEAQTVSA